MAKRRTLFDDRPVEIAELTYIIKQDLSAINQSISALQALNKSNPPAQQQVGEHSKNVVVMLQGKLADVSVGFREVLEVRTKNIQKGRERTENFVSSVKGGLNDQGMRQRCMVDRIFQILFRSKTNMNLSVYSPRSFQIPLPALCDAIPYPAPAIRPPELGTEHRTATTAGSPFRRAAFGPIVSQQSFRCHSGHRIHHP